LAHTTASGHASSFSTATQSFVQLSFANPRRLRIFAALFTCCAALLIGVFIAQPTHHAYAASFCIDDVDGTGDVSGDDALNQMCADNTGFPTTVQVQWSWDDTSFSASNTADACAAIDTNGNGNANYAICAGMRSSSIFTQTIHTCANDNQTSCNGSANTGISPSCTIATVGSDTVITCNTALSNLGNTGSATLLNVCSYSTPPATGGAGTDCVGDSTPARFEIKKVLVPSTDSGKFNLQIDGNTAGTGANVGNAGSTGEFAVTATGGGGTSHTFGETAGTSTNLTDYAPSFECRPNNGTGSSMSLSNVSTYARSVSLTSSADVVCTITNTRKLSFSKSAQPSTFLVGDTVTYTLNITNNSGSSLSNARITDTLPSQLTYVSSNPSTGSYNSGTGIWSITTLNSSASLQIIATVNANVVSGTQVINTASASAPSAPTALSASTTNNTQAQADLQISKTDGSTTYTPGDAIAYTIIVSNTGPGSVTGATVADTLPANITGITWTCVASGGASCTGSGSGNLNQTVNLPKNSKVTFTVNGTVSASASGNLVNTATVSAPSGVSEINTNNNSATDTDTNLRKADLQIRKTDGSATYIPGTAIAYTLIVTNAGPSDITAATVADTLPSAITGSTWTCTASGSATCTATGNGSINDTVNLPAGDTLTYSVNGAVAANATGNLINTASVSAPGGVTEINNANNSATDTDTAAPKADLQISKTDGSAAYTPGSAIAYTIIVNNAGPSDVTGATVADTLPAEITGATWTCNATGGATCTASGSGDLNDTVNVPVGDSLTYSVNGTVAANATGNLINTASVSAPSGTTDNDLSNNSATDTDTAAVQADLSINKLDNPDPVTAGRRLTYTLVIFNAGPSVATGIAITDALPPQTTLVSASDPDWNCTVGDPLACTYTPALAVNGSASLQVVVDVSAAATGSLLNSAGLTASSNDSNAANNYAEASTVIHVNNVLQLSKTGPALAEPSDILTYLLSASNNGDSNATNVVITETVPELSTYTGSGWTCAPDNNAGSTCTQTIANLAANSSVNNIPFAVTLPAAVPLNSDTITNVAVMGNAIDSTEPVTVVTTLNVTRGLALSKTDGGIAAAPGEVVTYTLRYTNTGNIALANVRLTETVPLHSTFFGSGAVWSCPVGAPAGSVCSTTLGTLAGGASDSVQFSVLVVNPLPTGATAIDNVAEIGATDIIATVSATDTTPLNAVVALQLSKTADVASTAPSGFIIYTLRYTNTGNIGAANVPLTETVPANTSFVPASSTAGWLCAPNNAAGSTCNFTITSIPGGNQGGTVSFAVQVTPTVATGTPAITNTADLSGTTATVSTPLVILTGIALDKDDGGITGAPGQLITYTLRYTNTGNNLLTGVKLTETVPANTVFVGPSGVGNWSCAAGAIAGSTCVYTVGTLPALATGQVSFRVQISPTLAAGVNQVLNSALIADDSGAGGNDSEATPIITTVQLHLSKTANVASAAPNGVIIYTLSYSNTGNAETLNIPLTETVPANTVFVSANSSAGWSCANGAAAGTQCNLIITSLAGGAQGSVAFAVKVDPVLPVGAANITNVASIGNLPAVQVVTPLNTAVTLALDKSDLNFSALPNDTIVYTLTYANNGNIGTANAVLTETVPANTTFSSTGSSAGWSCADGAAANSVCVLNLGTLAGGGAGGDVQFAVKVIGNVSPSVTQITNTATLGSATGAPISASDNTPVSGVIAGAPDLVASKTDNRTQVAPGQTIVYVLTASNTGTANATGVTLSDPLPASVQFVSASDGGTLGGNNTVLWTIGTLAQGSSVQRSVTVTVKSTTANNTQIVNAATVLDDGSHGQEPDVDNNTSVDTDLVLAVPALTLQLSATPDGNTTAGRVRTGDHITYTLTVANTSVAQATNVTLRNVIPAGTQYVDGSANPAQSSGPNPLVWNLGSLSGGQTRTVKFSVVVTAIDNITAISNAATVLSSQTSPVNSNTVANPFQTTDVTPSKPFLYLPVLAK